METIFINRKSEILPNLFDNLIIFIIITINNYLLFINKNIFLTKFILNNY